MVLSILERVLELLTRPKTKQSISLQFQKWEYSDQQQKYLITTTLKQLQIQDYRQSSVYMPMICRIEIDHCDLEKETDDEI